MGEVVLEDKLEPEYFNKVLGELLAYTQYHFAEEEALMESSGIDARSYDAHVAIHKQFVNELGILAPRHDSEINEKAASLLGYLRHWLAFHILKQDQELALQIKAIEEGSTPADAYDAIHQDREHNNPLVEALDGLFKILSERNSELSELNRTLEEKVAMRTRELREANLSLERLSLTDFLTQLPNRRYGMQMLTHAMAESRQKGIPISCMMIDADHFKEVNDNYGHPAGDVVLMELAKTLKYACRSDDIVCRLGGDEFFIICPGTGHTGAMKLAGQILEDVRAMHVPVGTGHWDGSISIGVASMDKDNAKAIKSEEALVQLADESVYLAKDNGKNRIESVSK